MASQRRTKSVTWRGIWALIAVLAMVLAACGDGGGTGAGGTPAPGDTATDGGDGGQAAGEPLKIGVMNPFSGAFAVYGEQLFRGYEMAAEEANANGGVLGRQVELYKGDALTPDQAIPEAERLATQESVDLFIGTYVSAVSNAASDVANQHGLLYWDTNAVARELTERGLENFIRVGPNAEAFANTSAEVITEFIAPQLGKDVGDLSVWIEHEESIYGTSIAEIQQELVTEQGGVVEGVGAHAAGAADLTDSILRAMDTDPDVWVQTGYVSDVNLLLRTARDQGFDPPAMLLVGTGDTFETLEALGPDYLNGIMVVSYPWPPLPESFAPGNEEWLERYREKYGEDPVAAQGLTAYSGLKALFDVLEEAGTADPATVREAAAAFDQPLNSYANGYGVKFDENFQNTRAFFNVIQWQDGERVTIYPPDAAGDNEPIGLGD